ncbi:unnamed protein product [Cylicocyclus nassatus]|uniref:MULE transposase domain-containing protein n=1 Tax=Cylicocyclus nassatus TaxID=53992 RepID=A0AA36M324_CYLNA|nr:unnamed protein product [Cylicocyclus nassatus]
MSFNNDSPTLSSPNGFLPAETPYYVRQPTSNQELYATQPIIQQYPHGTVQNEYYVQSLPAQSLPPSTNREQAPAPQIQQQQLTQQEEVPPASITSTIRRSASLFRGVRDVSQKGIHKVIVYEIPGGTRSYIFMFKRKTSQPNVATYQCGQCKKANTYTAITVIGDDFMEDPTMLAHACIPVEKTKDKADRLSYKCLQEVRDDQEAVLQPTINYWLKVLDDIERSNHGDAVLAHYMKKNGYDSRRHALNRAVNRTVREVTMINVPDSLRYLPDGSRFLQVQQADLHIYMSQEIVKRAVDRDLIALVGDGNHQLNPRSGTAIPLLFAITRSKREDDYVFMFDKLKTAIQEANESQEDLRLRVILDFELAAINAARRVFPSSSVEGCAWHSSQAWVRKRNSLGILQFLKGNGKCGSVVRWWRTIKGLPFLPTEYFPLVTAMQNPPVERGHAAYRPCKKFLNYLRNTLDGPFQNMWCKYMVGVQRTTNSAENYHARLRKSIGKKYPPLALLILAFRSFTSVAKGTLARMDMRRNEPKTLRRKDRVRREKVDSAMASFDGSEMISLLLP